MAKKIFIGIITAVIVIATVILVAPLKKVGSASGQNTDYLRIHVRANSNSAEDQKVKYEVKEEVVTFLAPYIKECVTKKAAMQVIGGLTDEIATVCDGALKERGYNYGARASIRAEKFPTRVYGELTLKEDVYDALIVELGTGKGDNWWCVIYPPLCFTSASADVEYRSVIYDIIRQCLD